MDQRVDDWQGVQITIEKGRLPTIDFRMPNGTLRRFELSPRVQIEILELLYTERAYFERTNNVLSDG